MSNPTDQMVKDLLEKFEYDLFYQDLLESRSVKNIGIDGNAVTVDIVLGFPCDGISAEISAKIVEHLQADDNIEQATVNVGWKISAHKVESDVAPIPKIKNIIAIASGKGGVGKSTTTVNIALALKAEGASVGILDADIYGPSQPMMLGVMGVRPETDNKTIHPITAHGINSMSIGYLIDDGQAMIWRGPMVSNALQQLLSDTDWGELDYLIVDLPPGTGDIQLTLAQRVPVTAAVIVTTPQDIALLDARKAVNMFQQVKIPSIGIIENMSTHICSECGHEEAIFGSGGGESLAEEEDLELLGSLPLDMQIRLTTDGGNPTVVSDPDGKIAGIYKQIARRIASRVSMMSKDFRGGATPIMFKEA